MSAQPFLLCVLFPCLLMIALGSHTLPAQPLA
jgi:hypothetical protein